MELGDADEGMALLREGLSAVGEFGMRLFRPFHLGLPELHRLRGELRLRTAMDDVSRNRAAEDLQAAIRIADATGALHWKELSENQFAKSRP